MRRVATSKKQLRIPSWKNPSELQACGLRVSFLFAPTAFKIVIPFALQSVSLLWGYPKGNYYFSTSSSWKIVRLPTHLIPRLVSQVKAVVALFD